MFHHPLLGLKVSRKTFFSLGIMLLNSHKTVPTLVNANILSSKVLSCINRLSCINGPSVSVSPCSTSG